MSRSAPADGFPLHHKTDLTFAGVGASKSCADCRRTFPVLLRLVEQRPNPTGVITTALEVQT